MIVGYQLNPVSIKAESNSGNRTIMRRKHSSWWVFFLAIFLVLRDTPPCVDACCPVFRDGQDFRIADQRILVAWDPETKIEHFVREAAFKRPRIQRLSDQQSHEESDVQRDQDDFGFLVPSPSQPQIEESDASVFTGLDAKIQPRVQYKDRWSVNPFPITLAPFILLQANKSVATRANVDSEAIPPAVSVLQNIKVAGYEVAVLKASDASELVQWLQDHQYQDRKDLQEWVTPYVQNGWIISAFKYDSSSSRTEVGTVRISFQTDHPVFPYRVPKDQFTLEGQGNRLGVFVVGPGRASGSLGQRPSAEAWNRGQLRFSMPVARAELNELIGPAIPMDQVKSRESLWLTAWDDRTWPSSDQDLWFGFDSTAEPYQQVRTVVNERSIYLPIDILCLATLGAGLWVRRRVRSSTH